MTRTLDSEPRPLAFEQGNFYWNLQRVPRTLSDKKTTHPGRSCAIFVVHGIGQQLWTETAAQLRAGFEDAFEEIAVWQKEHHEQTGSNNQVDLPSPFVYEGYWANYDDVKATFPKDWECFNKRERDFFCNLWRRRVISGFRTVRWMLGQQLRLLHPKVLFEVGPFAWILYWPFQIVSSASLLFMWFRFPGVISGFVNDLRLYLDPRGAVERAIVQRIDERVEQAFLRMIGLDPEFRPLPETSPFPDSGWIEAGGERLRFDRVVWVAHSLGTVISYNVLSALFHKAKTIDIGSDKQQQEGVKRFREALSRFVTMGSPLDNVAFLFKKESLRPWPDAEKELESAVDGKPEVGRKHRALLDSGETLTSRDPAETEWWVNFYSVFDPISGALQSPFICGNQPPLNIHVRSGLIPGLAHLAYWTDPTTLRFILGRTYGTRFLKDKEYRPWPPSVLSALAAIGYFTWATILCGALYTLFRWGPSLLHDVGKVALKWITG
jgi:hypothetical protein